MSYKYETQYNSPNFTPAAKAMAAWGKPRTIEKIAIHWWGDPATNPSYKGVINTLINPARGASAHYVATGTNRSVACLVSPKDASWATNSANPYTISIECDPRCREEDYDVVAELIAQIRDAYGDLPLVPHNQFSNTRCPGNYNLSELDRRARLKDGSGEWGTVVDKNSVTADKIQLAYRELLGRDADAGGLNTYLRSGFTIERIRAELTASPEYRTRQANILAQEAAANAEKERVAAELKAAEAKAEAEAAAKLAEEEKKRAEEEAKANEPNPTTTTGKSFSQQFRELVEIVKKFLIDFWNAK